MLSCHIHADDWQGSVPVSICRYAGCVHQTRNVKCWLLAQEWTVADDNMCDDCMLMHMHGCLRHEPVMDPPTCSLAGTSTLKEMLVPALVDRKSRPCWGWPCDASCSLPLVMLDAGPRAAVGSLCCSADAADGLLMMLRWLLVDRATSSCASAARDAADDDS